MATPLQPQSVPPSSAIDWAKEALTLMHRRPLAHLAIGLIVLLAFSALPEPWRNASIFVLSPALTIGFTLVAQASDRRASILAHLKQHAAGWARQSLLQGALMGLICWRIIAGQGGWGQAPTLPFQYGGALLCMGAFILLQAPSLQLLQTLDAQGLASTPKAIHLGSVALVKNFFLIPLGLAVSFAVLAAIAIEPMIGNVLAALGLPWLGAVCHVATGHIFGIRPPLEAAQEESQTASQPAAA